MPRNEVKFLINFFQYEYLLERFNFIFDGDHHNKSAHGYPVFSAYFDTLDLKYLYQKINGEFEHTKIRLRSYETELKEGNLCFLEAKLKSNESQKKIRIPLVFDYKLLSPMNWLAISNPQLNEILSYTQGIQHCVNVYYERQAYEYENSNEGKVRLNFDSQLAVFPKDQLTINKEALERYRAIPQDQIILEVKTPHGNIPDFIKAELKSIGVEQVRISKYATGVIHLSENRFTEEVVT